MTVEALRRGRPEVLSDLLEEHGSLLHGVAYLILRDPAAAEDVVADTLLSALEHGHGLRDPAALRPWLLRIATNHALAYRRKGARIIHIDGVRELAVSPDPVTADDRTALLQAVMGLPPRMRAAIVLRYYADLPVDQVAASLGVSLNTVKSQLKSALGHLRTALAEPASPIAEEHHARA